jgi:hypothetical protein
VTDFKEEPDNPPDSMFGGVIGKNRKDEPLCSNVPFRILEFRAASGGPIAQNPV